MADFGYDNRYRHGRDPEEGKGDKAPVYRPEPAFASNFLEAISKRDSSVAKNFVERVTSLGPVTAEDVTEILWTVSDKELVVDIAEALFTLTSHDVDPAMVEILPALIVVAERMVLDSDGYSKEAFDTLEASLERVLDAAQEAAPVWSNSEKDSAHAAAVEASIQFRADMFSRTGERDLEALRLIAQRGEWRTGGYWQSVEMLCTLDPSPRSLFYLAQAIEQHPEGKEARVAMRNAVKQSVREVSRNDFMHCVEWISSLPRVGHRAWATEQALIGLSPYAAAKPASLIGVLTSNNRREQVVGCDLCILIGMDPSFQLSLSARNELATVLQAVKRQALYSVQGSNLLLESAVRAWCYVTQDPRDATAIRAFISQALQTGRPLSADVIQSYAQLVARLGVCEPKSPVVPQSNRSTQEAPSERRAHPKAQELAAANKTLLIRRDVDGIVDRFVPEFSTAKQSQVLRLCDSLMSSFSLSDVSPRSADTSRRFYGAKEVAAFALRYQYLIEKGRIDVAAVLLPELLSTLDVAMEIRNNNSRDRVLEVLQECLEQVSYALAINRFFADYAVRRFSDADWHYLTALPERAATEDDEVSLELAVAALGVRAAIGEEREWQDALFTMWRTLSADRKGVLDYTSLSMLSVIAERRTPGAAWEVLVAASSRSEHEGFLREFTYGLLGNPIYPRLICKALSTQSGELLSKMFIIAQSMREHFTPEQRETIKDIARKHVNELGGLSLDAVVTLSIFSQSTSDAQLLMSLDTPIGVSEAVYTSTCADSAARILRAVG